MVQSAGRADRSAALDRGVQVGLVVYGIMHLVIAVTAFQVTLGDGGANASQQGAFARLADTPLGAGVLWMVAGGFIALVVWQAVEAAVGHRGEDGAKRVMKRLGSAAKAVVYAILAYSAGAMASGSGGSGSSTDSLTARLMSAPGGQLLVALVGVGVLAVGGYLGYRGWAERFTADLDHRKSAGGLRGPILLLGKVGHLGKGASLVAVGVLFVVAAVRHQPRESGGLDVALHELLRQPFGSVLVGAVALGLACFGLYCFAWARHLAR